MNEFVEFMKNRFGIDEKVFDGLNFYEASKGRIFIGPDIPEINLMSVGLLAGRKSETIKPSTNIVQIVGKYAKRNVISLNKDQAIFFVNGDDLEISDGTIDGYVILKYDNAFLGCGLLKDGKIKNMIPKAKRMKVDFL